MSIEVQDILLICTHTILEFCIMKKVKTDGLVEQIGQMKRPVGSLVFTLLAHLYKAQEELLNYTT